MKPIVLALALALVVPTAFAADNTSARRYGTSEALSVQDARMGEVLMVRPVQLKSDKKVNAGSAIGAITLGIISNGLVLLRVDVYWVPIVQGVILIVAIFLNSKLFARLVRSKT